MLRRASITLGQYVPGDSIIHRLDPRTKILGTLAYVVILFLIRGYAGYGVMAALTALFALVGRLPIRLILRGLRPILIILVFTVILNMFMTPGEVIYQLGPFRVTDAGVVQAALMASRLLLLITTTSMLTLTTAPVDLTEGIEYLLNPFRRLGVPAHELAMMMTIALRFIPTLLDELERIMKAQMARGADFESGNFLKRARNMIPLLVPLFISAFRRADDLALAMEARCYRGGEGRTRYRLLHVTSSDLVASVVMTCGFFVALFV